MAEVQANGGGEHLLPARVLLSPSSSPAMLAGTRVLSPLSDVSGVPLDHQGGSSYLPACSLAQGGEQRKPPRRAARFGGAAHAHARAAAPPPPSRAAAAMTAPLCCELTFIIYNLFCMTTFHAC